MSLILVKNLKHRKMREHERKKRKGIQIKKRKKNDLVDVRTSPCIGSTLIQKRKIEEKQ